jgi:hypothetical protein
MDVNTKTLSLVNNFKRKLATSWNTLYEVIMNTRDKQYASTYVLEYICRLAGELTDSIDFELTFGECNRINYDSPVSNNLVELYVSPKLNKKNITLLDELATIELPNLHIVKYRAYNKNDPFIESVETTHTYKMDDFYFQSYMTFGEEGPARNIIIYITAASSHILKKKPVTFINTDGSEFTLEKWMPTVNVVDILLLNVIGEYNLLNATAYIEFIPEGDPIVNDIGDFAPLTELRKHYPLSDSCVLCSRQSYQRKLSTCSEKCPTLYCSNVCKRLDTAHVNYCVENK